MKRTLLALAVLVMALTAVPAQAASTKTARFGHATTLHGFDGERMLVRPFKIGRLPLGEFDDRPLVGVWVSLKNVGRTTYSDSPSNGATLVTRASRTLDATFVGDDSCDGGSSLRVPPGQKRVTCLAFETSSDVRFRYFEFTLNSGFADQLGQWRGVPAV